jgi:hypothetical protein
MYTVQATVSEFADWVDDQNASDGVSGKKAPLIGG